MANIPLVSIIMTCYNRQMYIREAIESVLACGYENFELIIVDDCSKDNTVEIARGYADADDRIKLYINERNLGDYPNRNRASLYAEGKYLVNADSDDTMYPGVLSKWVDEMERQHALFGIFAKMDNQEPLLLTPNETIRKHFFEKPLLMFGPGATIVLREFFFKMKAFPEKYGPANDMYHHIKLAASTSTLFFPFPLINYRVHASQELNNKYSYLFNNYNYLKDALTDLELPLTKKEIHFLEKKNKRRFVVNMFGYMLKTGNFKKTIKAVEQADFSARDFVTGIIQL